MDFLINLNEKHHEIVSEVTFESEHCVEENKLKLKKETLCSVVHLTDDLAQKNILKYSYLQKGKKKGHIEQNDINYKNFEEVSFYFKVSEKKNR